MIRKKWFHANEIPQRSHFIYTRMVIIKKIDILLRSPHTLLVVAILNDAATLENSWAVSEKLKHGVTI